MYVIVSVQRLPPLLRHTQESLIKLATLALLSRCRLCSGKARRVMLQNFSLK